MGSKKEGVKVIVFDVEGVLQIAKTRTYQKKLHTNLGVHERVSKKLSFQIDQYFDYLDTDYSLSLEGKISKEKLLKNLSIKFDFPKKKLEKVYLKAYKKKYGENKFLLKYVKRLKKEGFKVAILSDQWHFSSPALIPKKFYKIFHPVVISCNVGARKPNPKIYKILLKRLKVSPKEVLFIDDRPWNLTPIEKLGGKVIAFTDNENFKKQIEKFEVNFKR